jgi:hypothetical protein
MCAQCAKASCPPSMLCFTAAGENMKVSFHLGSTVFSLMLDEPVSAPTCSTTNCNERKVWEWVTTWGGGLAGVLQPCIGCSIAMAAKTHSRSLL